MSNLGPLEVGRQDCQDCRQEWFGLGLVGDEFVFLSVGEYSIAGEMQGMWCFLFCVGVRRRKSYFGTSCLVGFRVFM